MATPTPTQDIPTLLRFLTQDAKIPLFTALSKVKALQAVNLTDSASISGAGIAALLSIFPSDEKLAKQVLNAAKRVSKRKANSDVNGEIDLSPSSKRQKKSSTSGEEQTPAELEASLALPMPSTDEDAMVGTVLVTNRAPLVLAFAVALLKYTMPAQPLSSRLSLAQAVVSANSRTKAVSIGLEGGKSAEEEGWGKGQPGVRIMGREVRVLKRWGYDAQVGEENNGRTKEEDDSSQQDDTQSTMSTVKGDETVQQVDVEPALWGLDLEALKKSNGPPIPSAKTSSGGSLPIYTPQSARAYLLRSFAGIYNTKNDNTSNDSKPKKTKKDEDAEREHNLGLLLGALDLLFQSWSNVLTKGDLDRRAWNWYVQVRPEVQSGVAGWGGKGEVKLAAILDLRRR